MNNVWVKLGSGKVGATGAGNKARLLDEAAHAGIRVPRGVMVRDTAWDQAVLYGYLELERNNVTVLDAKRFIRFLNLPKFQGRLAVRSAFSAEDGSDESLAGYFETVLNVDAKNPQALADAISQVLVSTTRYEGHFRRDVLIMEMVNAQHAGVAFTEREYEDDWINYTAGTAEKLVAGKEVGQSTPLAKLRAWERELNGDDIPAWQSRLQVMLREVRRWLGKHTDWDIEWADDGQFCYLVQVRPVTRATRRDEAFTIANHKEILPELPSVFMTSIIESCSPDLFAYYRNFDPCLPDSRPFIEVFKGRPYINLSLMSEMMRSFGLPTRLVTDNIGGETDRVYGLNFWRVVNKSMRMTLPRFAWAQLNSVRSARHATDEMLARTENPGETFHELTETLRWLYTRLVTEMFSLTAAIGPMLLLLRQFGVIEEHTARQQTVSTQIYTDLTPLRRYVAERNDLQADLTAGRLPDDEQFHELWSEYMAKYGHRGIYESDIARPRYREDPAPVLGSLLSPPPEDRSKPRRTIKGLLTAPLWWQAGRTMRAREQWRHDVMIGFESIRERLLELAEEQVEQGALPDQSALWLLDMDEVAQLDVGWQPKPGFFEERKAEIAHLKHYHLPDLLRRRDDLEQYREDLTPGDLENRLSGISLTKGAIQGRAWVLSEPGLELPEGFNQADTILIARSVDAGWISTFSRVSGVVVETGGDLSHGSIILREIGLPAVTNVRQATRHIATGDEITLDAASGIVTRVSDPVGESSPHPKSLSRPPLRG